MGAQGRSDTIVFLLKDNGRWRPRVPDELFGTLLPADRANFGGSPRAQSYMIRTDLTDTRFAAWAMTQPPDPTLPSRAHHKDYVSRTTSSNYSDQQQTLLLFLILMFF